MRLFFDDDEIFIDDEVGENVACVLLCTAPLRRYLVGSLDFS